MAVVGNVIHFDPADFYCARQCQESIKWCTEQDRRKGESRHSMEIDQERELYKTFLGSILQRVA
jgi:hypothetical protein